MVSERRIGWIDSSGVEFATTDLGGPGRFSPLAADPDGIVYVLRDDASLYALPLPRKPEARR